MIKEKFTAIIISQGDNGVTELVIRRSIRAGIDGPIFSREIMKEADATMPEFQLDAVDKILKDEGFQRVEGWRIRQTYSGVVLEAELLKA